MLSTYTVRYIDTTYLPVPLWENMVPMVPGGLNSGIQTEKTAGPLVTLWSLGPLFWSLKSN